MTEEQAFLNAITANPDDHTAKLAYADLLQDHDDPRAEIVRLRVQVAALQDCAFTCPENKSSSEALRGLLAALGAPVPPA